MNYGLEKQECGSVLYYTPSQIMNAGGVNSAFSTCKGGVSSGCFESMNLGFKRGDSTGNVLENYRRFCEATGFEVASLVFNTQVHSTKIVKITSKVQRMGLTMAIPQEADGFITDVKGVTMAAFYADCPVIMLYDPVRSAAGILHSGWRGTVADIVGTGVRLMIEEYGCKPENILTAVGPSICSEHFEVNDEVADQFRGAFGNDYAKIASGQRKIHINLCNAIAIQMLRAGVPEDNITLSNLCTCCERDQFFSYRRLGDARGSNAAFLELTEGK